jgi:hypothetical protein
MISMTKKEELEGLIYAKPAEGNSADDLHCGRNDTHSTPHSFLHFCVIRFFLLIPCCEPKSDAISERVTIVVYMAGLAGCFTYPAK